MSRIDELKKQNPNLNINLVDLFSGLFQKTKYVELLINLIKPLLEEHEKNRKEMYYYDKDLIEAGFSNEQISKYKLIDLMIIRSYLEAIIGLDSISDLLKFVEYNERNLVKENDITKYRSFDEIININALIEIQLYEKSLEKEVITVFNNENWLVIKPLTIDASIKYGSGTRWCTASKHDEFHFYKYSTQGVLIYIINRDTGEKIGAYKSKPNRERELSFWNSKDERLDSMETNLPDFILKIIRDEFANSHITNYDRMDDKCKKIVDGFYAVKDEDTLVEPIPIPTNFAESNYIENETIDIDYDIIKEN
jgi:hypothetical protein